MTCAPKDSDQPGHRPSLISLRCPHEEALGPWLSLEHTALTDRADTQADLRICWAYRSFCWFCCAAAQLDLSRLQG